VNLGNVDIHPRHTDACLTLDSDSDDAFHAEFM
jgi:hypothetical protein